MKTKSIFLSILFTAIFAVDYQTEIQPIFDSNCGNCHLGNSSGGLNLSNYDNLMEGSNNGDVIVPGNHAASELYDRITRDESAMGDMPPTGSLEQNDIDLIAAWIDEGALEQPQLVTFNVNMSQQDVGEEGPTLWIGNFYPEPGFIMTDEDGDGIWSYSIALDPGTYTYKYRNGWWTDWNTGSGWEEVPAECEVGQWGDREVIVESNQNLVLDTVCFSSCSEECFEVVYSNVTFQVDMSQQNLSDSDVVYLQGTFNGWCGHCNPMSDVNGDDIWELTLELPIGENEYLFTTDGWDGLQGGAPIGSGCDWLPDDSYGNYGFILEEEDLLLTPYCFGTCWDTCQPPADVDVTFNVDMSGMEVSDDGVYMIGNYQLFPWSLSLMPTEMTDSDGDNIYSATVTLQSSQLVEYKFVNGIEIESNGGIGDCGNNPDSECSSPGSDCNNREFQIPDCQLLENGDCVLDPVTVETSNYNSCNTIYANVNFSIDFNGTGFPNADYDQCGLNGSWNAEGDQWLGWGLLLSDDDQDGIFTGTVENLIEGSYEFVIFCSGPADGWSGWGEIINAPLGENCDFDPSDEWGNYGFTVIDSDIDVAYCAASCEETCSGSSDGGDDGGTSSEYNVTFELEGLDDCGFISVTGNFDNWSGWGATTDTDMQITLPDGEYEFTVLCVDTSINEWWNDIWGSSTQYSAPLGSECDAIPDDEYPNYGFTVGGSDVIVSYCAGTCDENCNGGDDGGAPTDHTVTFNIDGVDDCDFVSVTGTFDEWSGWGANTDNGMQATMVDGDYEFVILCVTTEGEWWNDIWANSTIFNAPIDGSCWNGDVDYANYIFSVAGSDLSVSYCAGSCDETCEACLGDGDVNGDGVLNVVDVVQVVSHVLGSNSLGENECHADLNGDEIVNVVDIVIMVNSILGG